MASTNYSTVLTAITTRAADYENTWATYFAGLTEDEQRITTALIMAAGNGPSGGAEVLTATRAVTAADNGKTFYINHATGFAITLPAAALGLRYLFISKLANTSGDHTITAATADTIIGWPVNIGGADSVADGNAAGDVLNFKANAALAGDMAEFFSDGTSWMVRATAKAINAITITG